MRKFKEFVIPEDFEKWEPMIFENLYHRLFDRSRGCFYYSCSPNRQYSCSTCICCCKNHAVLGQYLQLSKQQRQTLQSIKQSLQIPQLSMIKIQELMCGLSTPNCMEEGCEKCMFDYRNFAEFEVYFKEHKDEILNNIK